MVVQVVTILTERDDMRLALIIDVRAIGLDYVSESFDWLDFPKRQLASLIWMAKDIFWP